MGLKEKIIFHVMELSLLGLAGLFYAKSQYYQGRVDMAETLAKSFTELLDECDVKVIDKEDEEA